MNWKMANNLHARPEIGRGRYSVGHEQSGVEVSNSVTRILCVGMQPPWKVLSEGSSLANRHSLNNASMHARFRIFARLTPYQRLWLPLTISPFLL